MESHTLLPDQQSASCARDGREKKKKRRGLQNTKVIQWGGGALGGKGRPRRIKETNRMGWGGPGGRKKLVFPFEVKEKW